MQPTGQRGREKFQIGATRLGGQVAMQMPEAVKDRVVRRLYGLDSVPWPASAATRHIGSGHVVAPSEIAEGVWRLSVHGANVYFVRSTAGRVLVDAAWPWGNCGRIIQPLPGRAATPDGAAAWLRAAPKPDRDPRSDGGDAASLRRDRPSDDGALQPRTRAWYCGVVPNEAG